VQLALDDEVGGNACRGGTVGIVVEAGNSVHFTKVGDLLLVAMNIRLVSASIASSTT
jgi:hypothetical protein